MKLLILLHLLFSTSLFAQDKFYFDRLNLLSSEISSGTNENFQFEYISIFPNNFKKYTETFGYFPLSKVQNLYSDATKHISTLEKISKKYPEKVMELMLNIAVDGTWEADAVSHLQHSLAVLIIDQIDIFISSFTKLKKYKQNSIIRFLADTENHQHYKEYKSIMEILEKKNKILYDQFLLAKNKRMMRKH